MQISSNVFHEVVNYLDHHSESLRIKKLLFCISKKYWENDTNILNSVPLDDLLQELVQSKPNIEQLTFSVYKLVKTLNRPKVYAPLAKVIIDQMGRLYSPPTPSPVSSSSSEDEDTVLLPLQVEPTRNNSRSELIIDQVVTTLATHQEESRIKKLIFAACKNKWENSTDVIDRYGLKNLILELRDMNQTKNELQQAFNRIVDNINKKNLYVAISSLIIHNMAMLYDTEVDYEEGNKNHQDTQIFATQIIHLEPEEFGTPSYRSSSREDDFVTSIIDLSDSNSNESQMLTELHFSPPEPAEQPQREYDPFELRLEIMQYTNPLRAKILLFSLLFHPWDRSGQDWSTLRSYTLEDLLEQLIQSGKSLKEIEINLFAIARSQTDVDANLQTAGVIVQAMQHIL